MKALLKKAAALTIGEKGAKKLQKKLKLAKPKWEPPPADGKVRLNLGCGDKILENYINVDFVSERKDNKVDMQCDLRALTFPQNYADEMMSIHVIEHFYPWEAEEMLRHWITILKPGGKLILECPNILSAAKALLADPVRAAKAEGKDGQLAMWPLYGDPSWRDPLMCHKWGYTPVTLIDLLQKCGFKNVRQEPAQFKQRDPRDMRVVGEK
ncbi:MAG: methyltransferase domain-containing protein [Bdellovibrionales bacterium]